jgi:hypothetical protein
MEKKVLFSSFSGWQVTQETRHWVESLTCGLNSRMTLRQRSAHPMKNPFWPRLVVVHLERRPNTAVVAPQSSCVHSTFSMLIARAGHIRATSSTTHILSACIVLFASYMARQSFPMRQTQSLDFLIKPSGRQLQSHTL